MRRVAVVLAVAAVLAPPARAAQEPHSPADAFVTPAPREPLPSPAESAMERIRAGALAAHIGFLASPALEGRGLGSRGLDAAAEYAASALVLAGIAPLSTAEGSAPRAGYFQPVPLREITHAAGELVVERRSGEAAWRRAFAAGTDVVLPEVAPQVFTAPVVFAGLGIREPELGRDDWQGLDVRGKAVLVLGGLPPATEWHTEALRERYDAAKPGDRWAARLAAARAAGAAALLAVEDDPTSRGDEDGPTGWYFLAADAAPRSETLLVRISPAAGGALLAAAGLDLEAARTASPRELPGAGVTIRVTGDERAITSRNVLGVIPGSDRALRGQAVVIGAHLDHLGRVGDAVYPGADDDASGVASLIEIAKAFASLPEMPERTVVFAFWTGEEEGKLGSGYFVRHPLWPLAQITAYLNLDMIGHPWSPAEIAKLVEDTRLPDGKAFLAKVTPAEFAEPGLPPDAPAIATALRRASRATEMALHLDYTDGTSGGSDYRDFARAHVPFVRFFGNFFPAYHGPGDTVEALDATQVERMARLAFATAWLLAQRPSP